MIEPHFHCAECQAVIATKIKLAGGKTKDAPVFAAAVLAPVPGPTGVTFIQRKMPVCTSCHERVEAQSKATETAKKASRIIVPQLKSGRSQ